MVAREETEHYDRAIDVQLSRLRRKLAGGRGSEDIIRTVRNEGYLSCPQQRGLIKAPGRATRRPHGNTHFETMSALCRETGAINLGQGFPISKSRAN
jgi:hypothetical protein